MTKIHQIYCTHCTYGSSALEQREGELAERVLGYSARAGSLERNALRGYYRQVERFLYYYLPSDSPPEERLRLDAGTAPCRMFYSPSFGKLQMLGQVVYRRHDTAGRAGSYFAHVLFSDRDQEPWPVLECLRLWGAPWVAEDSPEHSKHLPTLAGLDELLQGRPSAIDDDVLLSFLTTSPGQAFNDPRHVIPARWRAAPTEQRTELLADVLQAYIELGTNRRESVLLVCEPSLAALVFYGVARLLPPGAVRSGVSFSTYEPSPDRLPVGLAATTFYDPTASDVKPDVYRRRGYVNNTYSNKRSENGRGEGSYARHLVGAVLAAGWPAIDSLLEGFAAAGCANVEELESLVETHRVAPLLLDPAAPVDSTAWAHSPAAARYLGAAVERQLGAIEPNAAQLRALAGSRRQMLVVELVTARSGAESMPQVQYLLRNVAPERLGELLASPQIGWEAKVETLAFHLSSTGRFPDGCDILWSGGAKGRASISAPPLLPTALARLAQPALASLFDAVPEEREDELIVALARACPIDPRREAVLQRFLAEVVDSLDDDDLVALLTRYRSELQAAYLKPEPHMAERLSRLLFELPERPREFAQRLELLSAWVDYFREPGLAENRLGQWRKVNSFLVAMRDGRGKNHGGLFRTKAKPDYKLLADALRKAMPASVYTDDLSGAMKKKRLRDLGTHIVGSPDFLPPAAWNKITRYFEYGDWNEAARTRSASGRLLRTSGKPKHGRHGKPNDKPWYARTGSLAAIVAGSAAAMFLYGTWHAAKRPRDVVEGRKPASDRHEAVGAGESTKSTKSPSPDAEDVGTGTKSIEGNPATQRTNPPSNTVAGTPKKETHTTRTPYKDKSPKDTGAPEPSTTSATPVTDVTHADDDVAPPGEGPPAKIPDEDDDPMPDDVKEPTDAGHTGDSADMPDAPQTHVSREVNSEASTKRSTEPDVPDTIESVVEAPPIWAENVDFPKANSFERKTLTKALADSGSIVLKLVGPSYGGSHDKMLIFPETNDPSRMTLFRGQKKSASSPGKASPFENAFGTFQALPGQLSFQWIVSKAVADERCRKWFCLNGFVLQVKVDEGPPSYYALYEPRSLSAVEVNRRSMKATIRPGDLEPEDPKEVQGNVGNRALRLGSGMVHFENGDVREFADAADSDGKTAFLRPSGANANDKPLEIHFEKTKGMWTFEIVRKGAQADTDEETSSSDEQPADADAKVGFPRPTHVSATLYREVQVGKQKVRVAEIILQPPRHAEP
jgi:hypothetical protein